MIIKTLTVGEFQANCYLVACPQTRAAVVIDPGAAASEIVAAIQSSGFQVRYILNTHGHIDHIGANDAVAQATGAPLLIHEADATLLTDPARNLSIYSGRALRCQPADQLLRDGDSLQVGNLLFQVLHTPGHTPGGICLLCQNALFSGDTLFAWSIGRSDFPGGNHQTLIRSIKERLFTLPDETEVYPGHGERTTIGEEKGSNPFVA
ncbi:MAG: MBL fold metallo-hydrolase [Firmicutes bacterium]|nr:MBL fold metallo-hydrolase [Bacillota bacterium]MCL5040306.1 MBL fold metallo-hydrolase [Bacillota bacterium]